MKEIASALVKAQRSFGPALKTSSNPHFKSKYADLAACVEAVIDGLNSNGIALVQKTHMDNSGVTVETIFVHESGEEISCGQLHLPAGKQDPQGYGSALTYARRYSLMTACGIAPEEDDGNSARKALEAEKEVEESAKKTLDVARAVACIAGAKTIEEARRFASNAIARATTPEQKHKIESAMEEKEAQQ